eukprot:1184501-Prorocentrum_minimum.AAC.1
MNAQTCGKQKRKSRNSFLPVAARRIVNFGSLTPRSGWRWLEPRPPSAPPLTSPQSSKRKVWRKENNAMLSGGTPNAGIAEPNVRYMEHYLGYLQTNMFCITNYNPRHQYVGSYQ